MSDMVQQPVIQLVQDLTMTAVVERNDCTDMKKKTKKNKTKLNQEVPGPVWIPIMHFPPRLKARRDRLACLADIHLWVASVRSPVPRSRLVVATVEGGWREGMEYSKRAASAGHLVIDKVVLRYQWDMLALSHRLHIQGTWSITNQYMRDNKTYVFFKTGITMHLVRTFKTVDLFLYVKEFFSEWTEW